MKALYGALPPARQGGYAGDASGIKEKVLAAIQPGDAVMIKGSNASGMHSVAAYLMSSMSARDAAAG